MRREKGSFRNGRKKGARANLHNFRSSGHGVKWNDQIAENIIEKVEATKMPMEAPIKVVPEVKKRGRPKKEK